MTRQNVSALNHVSKRRPGGRLGEDYFANRTMQQEASVVIE
ncbi:hypothetical protein P3T21_000579 [Paraburkholderia sp. GAS334]